MAQISTRTAGGGATPEDDSTVVKSSGLSIPQIVAGALAAATAAILGSFLGVAGTIGGAAVASIISTVGSSLYQRSLERTRDAVKDRLVVNAAAGTKVAQAVAKVTGDGIPVAAPARPGGRGGPDRQNAPGGRPGVPGARPPGAPAPAGPPNRPGAPPLPTHRLPDGGLAPGRRQVGTPQPTPQAGIPQPGAPQQLRAGGRTVTTRLDAAGRPLPPGPDPTRRIPDARTPDGPPRGPDGRVLPPGTAPFGAGPVDPTRRVPTPPPGPGEAVTAYLAGGGPDEDPTRLAGAVDRPRRKHSWKTWVTLGGVAASIFAIGLLASFAVESATGHPLSGGDSGTSVGSLFGQTTGEATSTSETPTTDSSGDSDTSTTRTTERSGVNEEQTGSNTSRTTTPTTTRPPSGGVLSSLVPQ
jgi:hypothetical protein